MNFKKRGLPHAHILICLEDKDKIKNIHDVKKIVSAQIPDINLHPLAFKTASKCLMHGPCGPAFPDVPCMKDGLCSKKYPKELCEETLMVADK